jgi:hypothetical protein
MDVRNICLGREWLLEIGSNIDSAEIMLAVIGPDWLPRDFKPAAGAMAARHEDDFVVLEVEAAVRNGIPVVPILVDGASLPSVDGLPERLRFLPQRQAFRVSYDNFPEDAARLLAGLQLSSVPARKRWGFF